MALFDRIAVFIDSKADVSGFTKTAAASAGLSSQQQGLLGKLGQSKVALVGWGAAGAAAGALAVAGAKHAADTFEALADQVRDVKRATGESAETASRWVAIGDDFGIAGDQISRAFARLGKNLQTGTVDLTKWGAEVVRGKDGAIDMQATIESISDAYNQNHDAAARSELLLQAFGRTGRNLIPILAGGKQAIHDMFAEVPEGQILDQGDLQSAREYKLALDDLDDAIREIEIAIGEGAAPALSDMAHGLADVARFSKPLVETLGNLPSPKDIFDLDGKWSEGVVEKIREITGANKEHKRSAEDVAAGVRSMKQALDDWKTSTLGSEEANLRVERALQSYNTAIQENGAGTIEAREAELSYKQAIDSKIMAMQQSGATTDEQVAALQYLSGTVAPGSPLQTYLQEYITKLLAIPPNVDTNVILHKDEAQRAYDLWLATNANREIPVKVAVSVLPNIGDAVANAIIGRVG